MTRGELEWTARRAEHLRRGTRRAEFDLQRAALRHRGTNAFLQFARLATKALRFSYRHMSQLCTYWSIVVYVS